MASKTDIRVALLRGINVGGKNRVEMPRLKAMFESIGLREVKTYINSGNVIFRDSPRGRPGQAARIEKAIQEDFGFNVKVLVKDFHTIQTIVKALPDTWKNDHAMKCDVMFLWEDVDKSAVIENLPIKPEVEDVIYVKGALLWRVDKPYITRSGIMKIVGTELYKKMTIRNCNTLRRIYGLMNQA